MQRKVMISCAVTGSADTPGRNPALPFGSRIMRTGRKIVSVIGMTEICPVRSPLPNVVKPLPSFGEAGLMSVLAADGFVIVPEGSEGYAQGASVIVYLYEGSPTAGNDNE